MTAGTLGAREWSTLQTKLQGWALDPALFVREAMRVTPEPWQIDVLAALVLRDRLAIRSGHGVGKSALLSWVVLWWMLTHFPAKVACTAPTAHQLEDVLWGEIAKWHRRLPEPFASLLVVKGDRVEWGAAPGESFAVARTARKETPEAFQGFHSDHMLFLVDEASGVEDVIFEVGQGSMSTVGAKTVMAGNPTRTSGYFFDAFHRLRERWWTRCVPCAASARVSKSYPAEVAETFGLDSNVYRVRVLGEFPLSEDDVVIPLHLCESAIDRAVEPSGVFRVVWGVDVARFGADRTALAKRQGNVLLTPIQSWHGKDMMQVAGIVRAEWDTTDKQDRPSEIIVDVIGMGAGVVDRLREMGLPVRGVNVAEAPAAGERYLRLRDELWFKARDWLADLDARLPRDDALIAELTAPKYALTSSGKLQVERKEDMKKRGLRSPDLADAFIHTFAGGLDVVEHLDLYRDKRPKGSAWAA